METKLDQTVTQKDSSKKPHDNLHIFINKLKYSVQEGVKAVMTGRELAALVPVEPAENAEITRKNSSQQIGLEERVTIEMADHFEIIRRNVQAG